MQSLALLFLLVSCSSFVADASTNHDGMGASIAKAQKKFHSYQSDPLNLLRGIEAGEYEQIYIQYHRCVWSEFSDGDNDGDESGCNGDGDGDGDGDANPWYMGNTQCYRANVAYSLYGVRSGDEAPENACRKRYYINTFFTNNGMENIGNLLGLEHYGDATSQCTLADDEKEDENKNGGDDNSNQYSAQLYPNARSYTTYCASGKFVTAMFNGAYCTGKGGLEMLNALTDLNNELDQVDCALAYSSEDYENENGRRLEEEENEENEEEGENEDPDIRDLLSYSNTCSILEHPKGCPDPYGVKKRFDLNPRTSNGFSKQMHGIDWLTFFLFTLGTLLLLLTCCIKDGEDTLNSKTKRRRFGFNRSRSRGRSRSPSLVRKSMKSTSNTKGTSDDADTVGTSGEKVKRKKKSNFKAFFSRKS